MSSIIHRKGTGGNRRPSYACWVVALLPAIVALSAQLFAEQAKRADDFVESMGIGSSFGRMNWTTIPEVARWSEVKPMLVELGIRHLRSGIEAPWLTSAQHTEAINRHRDLYYNYDIKFCWLTQDNSFADLKAWMQEVGLASIAAIEGPNEPWGWNKWFKYNGKEGSPAAVDYMHDLWVSMKNDNSFKNIPIVGASFCTNYDTYDSYLENAGQWANYGCTHPYIEGCGILGDFWQAILDGQDQQCNGHPLRYDRLWYPKPQSYYFTEWGCGRSTVACCPWMEGTQATQAKKVAIGYLEAMRLGVVKSYLYRFADDKDPEIGTTYSIVDIDLNRMQAFYAIKNLITLLGEKGQNSFVTHDHPITITGAPSSVHHLVLEKSTGVWYVILWNDIDTYNNDTKTDITNTDVSVTVNFGQTVATVKTYKPATGSNGINVLNTYSNVSQQTFNVPDHPLIIECSAGTPPARTAYNGPHKIPGRVEAEDYDNGGEGTAYHDSDVVNSLGQYRQDGVDIKTTGDSQGGGYDVGWTETGEWLEYTIDSVKADKYDINLRCGSAVAGAQVRVKLDGTTLGTITVPNLGNWNDKQTMTIAGVTLAAGTTKILRLEIAGGGADVNWIEFAKATATGAEVIGRHVTAGKSEIVEILSLDGRVMARMPGVDGRLVHFAGAMLGVFIVRQPGKAPSTGRMIVIGK
jgi:hypothetical protein